VQRPRDKDTASTHS